MNIEIKRILALTTLLAAGSTLAAGCVIKSDDDDDDDGPGGAGGVGASGGRGGSAGSSGSAGTAGYGGGGTGGSAGWDGGAGSAGTGGDASVCLGDTRTTDARLSGACERLPYFNRDCDGVMPLAADVCLTMETRARPGVFEEYVECIQQIPEGQACNDAGFQLCEEAVFPRACLRDIRFNTGGWTNNFADCTKMNARCPDLSVAECKSYLSALTEEGARAAFFCWDPSSRAADGGVNPECYDAFRECFFLEGE